MSPLFRTLCRLSLPILCFGFGFVYNSFQSSPHASTISFQRIGLWRAFGGNLLRSPTAIALGPDDTLLLTDRDTQKVYRIDRNGEKLIAVCGGVGQRPGRFRRPFGITSDDLGQVYVADTDNNRIQVFDSHLRLLRVIDPGLPRPGGIVTDGKGGLWVSPGEYSGLSYPIVHLDSTGHIRSCLGLPLHGFLKRDRRGWIWAVDDITPDDPIEAYDPDRNREKRIGFGFDITEDVAVDPGLVFAGDRGKAQLRVFDEQGRQVGAATHSDLLIPDAQGGHAEAPYGLAFDREGDLWATFLDSGAVAHYRILRK